MNTRKITVHLLTWIAYSMIIFYMQSNRYETTNAIMATGHLLIFQAGIFYLNLNYLLPRFLSKGNYIYYTLLILIALMMFMLAFSFTEQFLARPDFGHFGPDSHKPFPRKRDESLIFRILFVSRPLFALPIYFVSTLLWAVDQNQKRLNNEISLKNETLKTEMRFLKSQINPHFLFNALNNIYSLSYTGSKQTPSMIMKLSDMLRYVVYEGEVKKVTVDKEIDYIQNYIDFQRLKIGDDIKVNFDFAEVNESTLLEPMLLIPFVENAFKHGDLESNPDGFIDIKLAIKNNVLSFTVTNSTSQITHTKDKVGGIGIDNVKRRLDLSYGDGFEFDQTSTKEIYQISLSIFEV
ncbi:MAG: sensor histidine kinase [Cyclobacteriaceae bacterium]